MTPIKFLFGFLALLLCVPLVKGTTANYDIATMNEDWYERFTSGGGYSYFYTTPLIYATDNEFVIPNYEDTAFGDIDTSSIPTGDTIISATLYWYVDSATSYPKRGGPPRTYYIWIKKADESSWVMISTQTFSRAGWYSYTLTSSELLEIDKGQKTEIRFTPYEVNAGQFVQINIRSRDYTPYDTYDMYMTITHEAPAVEQFSKVIQEKRVYPILLLFGSFIFIIGIKKND
jgi:hypothetical protein